MRQHRHTPRAVRAGAGLALATALTWTATACGSDHPADPAPSSTAAGHAAPPVSSAPAVTPPPDQVLATIKGPQNVVITITSATRDGGGYVTVEGTVQNTGTTAYAGASAWRGHEENLQKNGASLAGATLVDLKAKKRYYVLRDTDGDCLCTTGLTLIEPGATMPVFAQFPAPPATTTQVEFELPTLPAASIAISK